MRVHYTKQYMGETEATCRLKSFCTADQWESIRDEILITQDEYVDIIYELVIVGCKPENALKVFSDVLSKAIYTNRTYKEVVEDIMWGISMVAKFK